jgi:uncharacterized membrane protein YhaH (DUF805 family)
MDWDWKYLLTDFDGRINRAKYWGATIAMTIVALIVQFILVKIVGVRITSIIALAFLYPAYALLIKRSNDRDRPQWIAQAFLGLAALSNIMTAIIGPPALGESSAVLSTLAMVLGLAAIYVLVDFGCLRGTVGPNQHGSDPLKTA